ncbi:MAG TPA: IclR family transcriptional regulator [Segeticoccus sp.]|uniref:IclR family transcriptional regulator n=1 Tax=Segeticoccus sp. TaxID=2706531 RepID=UPI002D7EB654|nr:IclR family transcriptional regulator [Segeticoccus sp.]HET8601798.1 IclR family transcriptional regulator [Segeticoccus sp.]
MKNQPHYAVNSVDRALLLAATLQVEGSLTVSQAADRLGVARSTAHRLLSMLVYRDFAIRDEQRRYLAGPVLAQNVRSQSRSTLLRSIALPHLQTLVDRLNESVNLVVLSGDQARFIASVESRQALRVGNRDGMAFPAHLHSGGKLLLADLPTEQFDRLYAEERWVERPGERPDLPRLRRELAVLRRRGFSVNAEATEQGVTAVGRGVRVGSRLEGAVSLSLPTVRFSTDRLPELVAALSVTTSDIERDLATALVP